MATIFNSNTTEGLVITPDTSGEVKIQSNGTDVVTFDSSGMNMADSMTIDASKLSGTVPSAVTVSSSSLSGALPAIDGSALTGIESLPSAISVDASAPANSLTIESNGALMYNNTALIASDAGGGIGGTNIDHIWHDDGGNRWHFCSDTSYRNTGNSGIQVGSMYMGTSGNTRVYAVRAWVHQNGTAKTDGQGFSSITNHGTGDFTYNFSTAQVDNDYAAVCSSRGQVSGAHTIGYLGYIRNVYGTTSFSVGWFNPTNSGQRANPSRGNIIVCR